MRLVLLRPFSDADRAFLAEQLAPSYEVISPQDFSASSVAAALADADVVLGEKCDAGMIATATRLRLIHTPGTALGGIDLDAASARGIPVCCSHSSAPLVAEHAVALLLALTRQIPLHDRRLRMGRWFRPRGRIEDAALLPATLMGRTIGLLGYGHIGKEVARRLAPFGARLTAHSRSRKPGQGRGKDQGVDFLDLDPLIGNCDALIASLPLTAQTAGLLDARRLATMKPGAVIVNVGRAGIIDENALYSALSENKIRGAALDVWWDEPVADAEGRIWPSARHPFQLLDNVVLSPHRAATDLGGARHLQGVIETLRRFAEEGALSNEVDPERGY